MDPQKQNLLLIFKSAFDNFKTRIISRAATQTVSYTCSGSHLPSQDPPTPNPDSWAGVCQCLDIFSVSNRISPFKKIYIRLLNKSSNVHRRKGKRRKKRAEYGKDREGLRRTAPASVSSPAPEASTVKGALCRLPGKAV